MAIPNPDKPELKIEDCKLNIYVPLRRDLLRHFFNRTNTLNIQYSIENIQSLQVSEYIPNNFLHKKQRNYL